MSTPQRDLTLAEVAELRRFTPRYLRELVRRHQIPVLRSGRLIRFDALSLSALEETLRCHSPSSGANPAVPSQSAAPSRANAYAASAVPARALLRSRCASSSKAPSLPTWP
jgi:excisionase family DNA binding protein